MNPLAFDFSLASQETPGALFITVIRFQWQVVLKYTVPWIRSGHRALNQGHFARSARACETDVDHWATPSRRPSSIVLCRSMDRHRVGFSVLTMEFELQWISSLP